MKKIDVCSLLGKTINDDEIQALLRLIKIDPSSVKLKRDDYTVRVQNKDLDVMLEFQPDWAILNPLDSSPRELSDNFCQRVDEIKKAPEGMLFLSLIFFRSNYLFDNGYSIDYDVKLNKTSKDELYEMFGKPYIENDYSRAIGWMVGDKPYAFSYDKETLLVNSMIFNFLVKL